MSESGETNQDAADPKRILWVVGGPGAAYREVEGTRVELTDEGGVVIWNATSEGEEIVFAASPDSKWSVRYERTLVKNAVKDVKASIWQRLRRTKLMGLRSD